MAKTPVQIQHIDQELSSLVTSFVNLPKIAAPFTTVVNRATVTDFSQDLMPRMGIERVALQALQEVQGESGPNGEKVWKPINDIHDQVRYVGNPTTKNDVAGPHTQEGGTSDYVEITFYGTGLNILAADNDTTRTATALVDGATPVSNFMPSGSVSSTITIRNYAPNSPISVISGLTLGLHTVKIISGSPSWLRLSGYEIINASGTSPNLLQLPTGSSYVGSKKLYKSTSSIDSYNSNFESGTLGTKGGHVVVYQKADGTIGKAVTPTDASQLNLNSASHTNESVIRTHHFREFGAGRADDFSLDFTFGSAKAFTLDDGTTSLTVSSAAAANNVYVTEGQSLRLTTSATMTFVFVGTGLDVTLADNNSGRAVDVSVDGSSIGTLSFTTSGSLIKKVVSGLSYGTHIVKFTQTTSANPGFINFITYGPKKPSIPSGAVELADYYIMSNFSAGTGDQSGPLSSGVIVKSPVRENVYVGSNWQAPVLSIGQRTGWYIPTTSTSADADFFSYTFVGTGVELYLSYNSIAQTGTLTIDGVSPVSGVAVTNGGSYSAGIVTLAGGGGQVQITGLTYGSHIVKLSKHSTNDQLQVMGVGIIPLIHSPKSNGSGVIQNTLLIGSNSIGDSRVFSTKIAKSPNSWVQAVGISSNPTTASTTLVPVADMTCTIKTTGNPIEIQYSIDSYNSAPNNNFFAIYVDGVQVGTEKINFINAATGDVTASDSATIPVAAGTHIVEVFWRVGAGTGTLRDVRRNLRVREAS